MENQTETTNESQVENQNESGSTEGQVATRVRNDAETFIRAWQNADTVQEAADALGITKPSAGQRASSYRTQGVPLKKMKRGGGARFNLEEAIALAQKHAPATETVDSESESSQAEENENVATS